LRPTYVAFAAERFEEERRRLCGLSDFRREVELDPFAGAIRRQQAAAGVEARLAADDLFFPQCVRAGERCVAAEIDLDRRREPAQREAVVARKQKCRLGEVHLRGDVLHPLGIALPVEQADRGRVALECLSREGVDLKEAHGALLSR
jgi:hypothetical protein